MDYQQKRIIPQLCALFVIPSNPDSLVNGTPLDLNSPICTSVNVQT